MKQLMRRFSRVADSSTATTTTYCLLRTETLASPAAGRRRRRRSAAGKVPSGHVPVYVGEEMERFAVSADLLNHPIFVALLNRSAQEYGYDQKGVLHIPCRVAVFERVLDALRSGLRGVPADVLDHLDSLAADDVFA